MAFTITNVLGEIRNVKKLYAWVDDGKDFAAYDCPFCASAVSTERNVVACENPWCSANPMMPVEAAQAQRDKAEANAREDVQRKRNHELTMIRISEDNDRRSREYRDFAMKVRAAKGCMTCSNQYRGKVRKHRAACPKAV